ncbi:MAG: hypothetical protein HOD92_23415 [Deltaproteobacteria bacterium]|jgi:predicted Fe-Mo cluster-binding NifX family protein|nr:hypothetical protein [Deltaproteobacteria bacterium]
MKIGLTVWENKISPVFDSSSKLMIVDLNESNMSNIKYEAFDSTQLSLFISQLNLLGVYSLICGAISEFPWKILTNSNIKVFPFLAGDAMDLVNAIAKGDAIIPKFLMPGCQIQHCVGRKNWWQNHFKNSACCVKTKSKFQNDKNRRQGGKTSSNGCQGFSGNKAQKRVRKLSKKNIG